MRNKENFEDVYNPMKVYASLRFDLKINKTKSQELAAWFSDCFYKVAIDEYHNEKQKNRLENSV